MTTIFRIHGVSTKWEPEIFIIQDKAQERESIIEELRKFIEKAKNIQT